MQRSHVVVVGGGFGGLASAVELARRGVRVTLLERETTVGGKARAVDVAGRLIDVGPTVLTMRWVFDEMFADCNRRLDEFVALATPEVVARHEFADGTTLDLFTDVEANADAIRRFAGPGEANAYRRFAAYGADIAQTVEQPFLRSSRPTMTSLLLGSSRIGLSSLARIDAHRSMWQAICRFFADPRLRALFARYATYVGSSPFEAPATLNLIAHVEREGVTVVGGGLSRLAHAISELARTLGVEILAETTARDFVVEDGRVAGVVAEHRDGQRVLLRSQAVVVNADIASIGAGALGSIAASAVAAPPEPRRSLSALTWAITARVSGFDLAHHTVFFSNDYPREHHALFELRRLPEAPTFYVCAQDRSPLGGRDDDEEKERLFIIANAPAIADTLPLSPEEIERCERTMLARLSQAGLRLDGATKVVSTPTTFERLAPGTGGAIYGEVSHGMLSPLARPGAQTKLAGLFVTGGSVHPGAGVPMAALGGRVAAHAVTSYLASTLRSHRAGTGGSTSTP
jgi:1-hydroxycarotenoid 3,4-desaturase